MAHSSFIKRLIMALVLVAFILSSVSVKNVGAQHHCIGDCVGFENCDQACYDKGYSGGSCQAVGHVIDCCCRD